MLTGQGKITLSECSSAGIRSTENLYRSFFLYSFRVSETNRFGSVPAEREGHRLREGPVSFVRDSRRVRDLCHCVPAVDAAKPKQVVKSATDSTSYVWTNPQSVSESIYSLTLSENWIGPCFCTAVNWKKCLLKYPINNHLQFVGLWTNVINDVGKTDL